MERDRASFNRLLAQLEEIFQMFGEVKEISKSEKALDVSVKLTLLELYLKTFSEYQEKAFKRIHPDAERAIQEAMESLTMDPAMKQWFEKLEAMDHSLRLFRERVQKVAKEKKNRQRGKNGPPRSKRGQIEGERRLFRNSEGGETWIPL